jgi:hypothetical protein
MMVWSYSSGVVYYLKSVWSMYPLVASIFGTMTAGFPITRQLEGTEMLTNALGAIITLSPILILPTITALVPIQTLLPIFGVPMFFPRLVCPIVTPGDKLQ